MKKEIKAENEVEGAGGREGKEEEGEAQRASLSSGPERPRARRPPGHADSITFIFTSSTDCL